MQEGPFKMGDGLQQHKPDMGCFDIMGPRTDTELLGCTLGLGYYILTPTPSGAPLFLPWL